MEKLRARPPCPSAAASLATAALGRNDVCTSPGPASLRAARREGVPVVAADRSPWDCSDRRPRASHSTPAGLARALRGQRAGRRGIGACTTAPRAGDRPIKPERQWRDRVARQQNAFAPSIQRLRPVTGHDPAGVVPTNPRPARSPRARTGYSRLVERAWTASSTRQGPNRFSFQLTSRPARARECLTSDTVAATSNGGRSRSRDGDAPLRRSRPALSFRPADSSGYSDPEARRRRA